ncbi:C39 family peptidase [Legionella oakridgensis]|uniref:C39 family peptidase n=1 Tax=Legionella oakridgensis TaxID=29423 RepID=UPI0003DE44B8|nr:C39 family peptidase [Legionella oakridgensis]ETO93918.1 peptidase_C39 like family [Legionella oakridgensis RV-2-2007]
MLIREKLYEQLNHASHQKMHLTTQAYLQFLDLGGRIHFSEMNFDLIRQQVDQNTPLISGLSATYLYQTMRDYTNKEDRVVYDEWLGAPSGHFVVIRGYEANPNTLHIADPYSPHPLSREHYYSISFSHWLHAFLLGIMTYDAELLVIKPAV